MEHTQIQSNNILLTALFGSHNYGLTTDKSDVNYKNILLPSFNDLYYNRSLTVTMNNGYHKNQDIDVRDIPDLLWNCQINFIEILFTKNKIFQLDKFTPNYKEIRVLVNDLYTYRHSISRMNLPKMYNSFIRIVETTMTSLNTNSEYNYDKNKFMFIMRAMDLLKRFADDKFKDFELALFYEDGDPSKERLLSYKYGNYTIREATELITKTRQKLEDDYMLLYYSVEPNKLLHETIQMLIKKIVQLSLQ